MPIIFLIGEYEKLAVKDERHLLVLAKNQLVKEMTGFLSSMNPMELIEKASKDLEIELGLREEKLSKRQLIPMPGARVRAFPDNFIEKARNFYKDKYGIEPFLMVAQDKNGNHFYSKYNLFGKNPKDVKTKKAQQDFVESMGAILTKERTKNNLRKYDKFTKHLSAFTEPPPYPSKCEYFYSLKFGVQKSFHIYNYFLEDEENKMIYYFCFNEMDIEINSICKNALENNENVDKESGAQDIQRKFIVLKDKANTSLPYFSHNNGRYTYQYDYPITFTSVVRNNLVFNPKVSKEFLNRIETTCMQVSMPEDQLKSKFYTQIRYLQYFLWSISFLFLICFMLIKLFGANLNLRLSLKIKLVIFFMVIIPILGFTAIADMINRENHAIDIYNCQEEINYRAKLLEQIFDSADIRLMLSSLRFKKELAEKYANNFVNNRFNKRLKFASKEGANWLHNVRILTNRMKSYTIPTLFPHSRNVPVFLNNNPLDMIGYFQIIQNMDLIVKNQKNVEREVEKLNLALGGTANFWDSMAPRHKLSLESYVDKPIKDLETLRRSIFLLVCLPQDVNTPVLIASVRLMAMQLIKTLYFNLINESLSIFSSITPTHSIEWEVFVCDTQKVMPSYLKHVSNSANLFKIAQEAFENRSTINTAIGLKNKTLVHQAVYKGNAPFIIVAEGIVEKSDLQSTGYIVLGLLLLIYSVCSVALLSNLIGEVFLSPIKVFSTFMKNIEKGDFNIEAQMSTDNELKELSNSFNQMAKGLFERDKMQRFVSDTLFESLNQNSQIETGATTAQTDVCILVSDIRGFTKLSEDYPPEEIVALLNDYLTSMESAIKAYGGSIEKIIGDAIVAAFYPVTEGEDKDNEHQSLRACRSALLMKKNLNTLNSKRKKQKKFTIKNGVGIATGEVLLGFAGKNARRREFLLIGDVVQQAENLEEMSKNGKSSGIFVDKKTKKQIKNKLPMVKGNLKQEYGELV